MKKIIKEMKQIGEAIGLVCSVLIAIMMFMMFAIVMLNIITRTISGESLAWSSELAPYLMVWASFLGSVVASKEKMHVAIDALINGLHGISKKIVYGIMYLFIIIALLILIYAGFVQTIAQLNQYSITMHFSVGYVYASMPISGVLMLYYTVLHILEFYFTKEVK